MFQYFRRDKIDGTEGRVTEQWLLRRFDKLKKLGAVEAEADDILEHIEGGGTFETDGYIYWCVEVGAKRGIDEKEFY